MGCCTMRNSLSNEDRIISFNERKLGISHCTPSSIELSIKKWIGSEGLTLPRFKKAAESLKINLGPFTSSHEPLVIVFKNFQSGNAFNVLELIAFCVYLCNALPEEKSKIWFDIMDCNLKSLLTYGQVKEFLSLLYRFTFKILPILSQGEGEMTLRPQDIEVYTNEALKHQRSFIDAYAIKVCPEHTLDKETFLAQMNVYSKLSYSDGLRQLVREFVRN